MTDEIRANFKEAFTLEVREIINKMIDDGKDEFISSVINIDTQAQEQALQQYLDAKRTPIDPEGSKVRKEMSILEAKGELSISSPEEEAIWQAKLDAEKELKAEKKEDVVQEPKKRGRKKKEEIILEA